MPYHRLLSRQLKKYFPEGVEGDESMKRFIQAVNESYLAFDDWNADCLAHFDRLELRMTAIIARYEAILDGREPQDVKPVPTGIVIKGPWARSDA